MIGCFCFCAWLFIYNLLPETKGKTIEENIKNMIPNLGNEISSFFNILTTSLNTKNNFFIKISMKEKSSFLNTIIKQEKLYLLYKNYEINLRFKIFLHMIKKLFF